MTTMILGPLTPLICLFVGLMGGFILGFILGKQR